MAGLYARHPRKTGSLFWGFMSSQKVLTEPRRNRLCPQWLCIIKASDSAITVKFMLVYILSFLDLGMYTEALLVNDVYYLMTPRQTTLFINQIAIIISSSTYWSKSKKSITDENFDCILSCCGRNVLNGVFHELSFECGLEICLNQSRTIARWKGRKIIYMDWGAKE